MIFRWRREYQSWMSNPGYEWKIFKEKIIMRLKLKRKRKLISPNLSVPTICECMYTQNSAGDCVCKSCCGDIYECECPLIHSQTCEWRKNK